ncbi:hypothetical protein CRYUN_Cryun13aG0086900 [Craigia yunnanensis]
MWKMKEYIMSGGDEEERAESFLDEESEENVRIRRIFTFGSCSYVYDLRVRCILALLIFSLNSSGILGTFGFSSESLIVFAKPIKFALLFTFGNVLAVGSMMFDSVRVYATAIYIGFVLLALICALWIQSKILALLAIICEICSLIWYCLSYIPFARRIVSDLMIRFCDRALGYVKEKTPIIKNFGVH